MFEEGNGLRQCPNISPIPFSDGPMIAEVMSRDRFNTDINESRDYIFVRIRPSADNQPWHSFFHTCRTAVINVKPCLRVGSCPRHLRHPQTSPLPITEAQNVSRG